MSRRALAGSRAPLFLAALAVAAGGLARATGWLGLDAAIRLTTGGVGAALLVLAARLLPVAPVRPRGVVAAEESLGPDGEGNADEGSELKRLAQLIRFSEQAAGDFHTLLRPRLAVVAERRLRTAGIDPSSRAEVTAALGPQGASLVVANAPPPVDRLAPGPPVADLLDVLSRLERLT